MDCYENNDAVGEKLEKTYILLYFIMGFVLKSKRLAYKTSQNHEKR